MAKILYSGIAVVNARGKLNQEVYSRNRGGNVVKQYVIPTNTITARKTNVQNNLTYVSQLWPLLPQSARDEWNRECMKYQKKNKIGGQYYSSGFNMFVQQTYMILLGGNIPTGLPIQPVFFHRPKVFSISIPAIAIMNFTVTWTNGNTTVPNGVGLIIRASVGVSQGINYKRSAIVYIKGLNSGFSTNGVSMYADYFAEFGALVSGTKIFFECFALQNVTGQRTAPLCTTAIVP